MNFSCRILVLYQDMIVPLSSHVRNSTPISFIRIEIKMWYSQCFQLKLKLSWIYEYPFKVKPFQNVMCFEIEFHLSALFALSSRWTDKKSCNFSNWKIERQLKNTIFVMHSFQMRSVFISWSMCSVCGWMETVDVSFLHSRANKTKFQFLLKRKNGMKWNENEKVVQMERRLNK